MEAYEELERLEQGVMSYYSGDYEKAARLLEPSVEAGWDDACCLLGFMYAEGLAGLNKDPGTVRKYWNRVRSRGIGKGSHVMLGRYTIFDGRVAPLGWFVRERRGNDFLLISDLIIDTCKYNNAFGETTWEQSDLRAFLNGEFLEKTFSARERERLIARTRLQNASNKDFAYSNGGNDTVDQIFVLSIEEAQRYYVDGTPQRQCDGNVRGRDGSTPPLYYYEADRSACGYSTPYAKKRGLELSTNAASSVTPAAGWWLRTPGYNNTAAAFIDGNARIVSTGCEVNRGGIGVRPAMWLRLETASESDYGTSRGETTTSSYGTSRREAATSSYGTSRRETTTSSYTTPHREASTSNPPEESSARPTWYDNHREEMAAYRDRKRYDDDNDEKF